jgi:hypothetical protein
LLARVKLGFEGYFNFDSGWQIQSQSKAMYYASAQWNKQGTCRQIRRSHRDESARLWIDFRRKGSTLKDGTEIIKVDSIVIVYGIHNAPRSKFEIFGFWNLMIWHKCKMHLHFEKSQYSIDSEQDPRSINKSIGDKINMHLC